MDRVDRLSGVSGRCSPQFEASARQIVANIGDREDGRGFSALPAPDDSYSDVIVRLAIAGLNEDF